MKQYGLIGYPIAQSFSKSYFSNKFETENLNDCVFDLFSLPDIGLVDELIENNPYLRGFAVTIPYKEAIIPYLDEVDEAIPEIKAVNCVTIKNGVRKGYNTDVIGFEKSIQPLLKKSHTGALILGTGGASKAAQFVLKKLHIPFVLVSRNPAEADIISYDSVTEHTIQNFPIIINCSPVGMSPNINECPQLPYHLINEHNLLFDMIYNPAETMFLQKGKANGAQVKNGYEMLITQAEANWKLWNS
jgi:shikimate dehydrogenase